MRRWLIAVFALHFFVSVGAFAFGSLPEATPPQSHAQALVVDTAAMVAVAQSSPGDPSLPGAPAQDHGLTDAQPDFPECLDAPMAVSTAHDALRAPPHPVARDLTSPVLDGPQRPPRGLPVLA